MTTKNSNKRTSAKSSSEKKKMGFKLAISTDTQVIFSKGLILGLIIIATVISAYYKIFEPVVWSSLMTIAGYVAFANRKTNTDS